MCWVPSPHATTLTFCWGSLVTLKLLIQRLVLRSICCHLQVNGGWSRTACGLFCLLLLSARVHTRPRRPLNVIGSQMCPRGISLTWTYISHLWCHQLHINKICEFMSTSIQLYWNWTFIRPRQPHRYHRTTVWPHLASADPAAAAQLAAGGHRYHPVVQTSQVRLPITGPEPNSKSWSSGGRLN